MTPVAIILDIVLLVLIPKRKRWLFTKTAASIDGFTFMQGRADVWLRRFTWELPQTIAGFVTAHALNFTNTLAKMERFENSLVVGGLFSGGSFSLGQFVFMGNAGSADWRDHLFVHEYGHTRQSARLGPLFLFAIAIPSLISFYAQELKLGGVHNLRWYETWANKLGADYFSRQYSDKQELLFGSDMREPFNIASFWNEGLSSPYVNPRNKGKNWYGHERATQWHWTDVLLHLIGLVVLAFLIWVLL